MKAILIPEFVKDVSTLKPSEVPIPSPSPTEYLVKITHVSPQHADILHAQGKHQNNTARGWCHPPFILGFDFAGIIISIPSAANVEDNHSHGNPSVKTNTSRTLRKGDRVFGAAIGAFAEYISVPGSSIRRIPDALTTETAVAMSGQAVSYAAVVHIAKVQAGEWVLVSGASGGLGSVCCMVSKALGASVIALAGDEDKAKLMRRDMNVDAVIVMKQGWVDEVLHLTDGKGADVCLDNTGMVNDAIRCLAYFGRIVILGFAARNGVMEQVKMNKLLLKSITVVGFRFGETARWYPDMLEQIWEGYLTMLETGRLKPMLYGKYHGLEDIARALGDLHQRKVYGKIVVHVADTRETSKI